MKAYDLAELAVRNLKESVLRNSLTTVGISVGVASLVAMLSLGIGLQQLATRRLVKSGLFDTVVVTSRRDLRNLNRGDDQAGGPDPAQSPALDEPSRSPFHHFFHVRGQAAPDDGGRNSSVLSYERCVRWHAGKLFLLRRFTGGDPAEEFCRRIAGQDAETRL